MPNNNETELSDWMTKKPLEGCKVLDFSRFYAGPYCAMLLGDLGADVVKIEPEDGDPSRHQGPPFHKGQSFSYLSVNRNKRSVALNMKSLEGRATARALALAADVIVHNFRPGAMERLGLGYDELSKENPRLIYADISGMGADGPDSQMGAFDLTIQAIGGYMSLTGERDGTPIKLGTSAFDLICGQNAAMGVMTALLSRATSGKGQKIETSLLESEVSYLVDAALEYLMNGTQRQKLGSEHFNVVPYKAFKCSDGWMVIGAGHQNLYTSFMDVLGRPDLVADPRFSTNDQRVANRELLYGILDAELLKWEVAALTEGLNAMKVPCAPVNEMAQVFQNKQVLHREMLLHVEHPQYGQIPTLGSAVKYSGFDIAEDWQAPPVLGEHNGAVIKDWLGEPATGATNIGKLATAG